MLRGEVKKVVVLGGAQDKVKDPDLPGSCG